MPDQIIIPTRHGKQGQFLKYTPHPNPDYAKMGFSDTFEVRFFSKFTKDGPIPEKCPHLGPCWKWLRAKTGPGYGKLSRGGRNGLIDAHVASFILHRGLIPSGQSVLHHCDNKWCINPSHLFLGTQSDNMIDDAKKRGRARVLTWEDVVKIRASWPALSYKSLSKIYKVQDSLIWAIITRRIWNHAPYDYAP